MKEKKEAKAKLQWIVLKNKIKINKIGSRIVRKINSLKLLKVNITQKVLKRNSKKLKKN